MTIGDRTIEVPFEPNEYFIAEAFGAVGHKTGGKLVVTNQRLLFQPWDPRLAVQLAKWGCKLLQVPHAAAAIYLVGKAAAVVSATAQGVGSIVAVDAIGQAGLLNLPKIRVTKSDGTVAEFGVAATPTTPNPSERNTAARDALVTTLRRSLL